MPSNTTAQDESGDGVPRGAATARRESRARRFVTRTGRLFRARQRTRPGPYPNADRGTESALSRRVLRDYHATNLAAARAGSEELVRAGFNTGDIPYGYRAHRVWVTPPGRRPRWRTRLVIEPVEAATVRMIFTWRGEDRVPVREIRRRLASARYPAPLDPETGQPGVWTVPVIRAPAEPEISRTPGLGSPPPRAADTPRPVGVVAGVGAPAHRQRRVVRRRQPAPPDRRVMTGNHYPDGLTPDDITALQREVDDELRRDGYPVPDWPDPPWQPQARPSRDPRPRSGTDTAESEAA